MKLYGSQHENTWKALLPWLHSWNRLKLSQLYGSKCVLAWNFCEFASGCLQITFSARGSKKHPKSTRSQKASQKGK